MVRKVLISGATGNIGGKITLRILETEPLTELVLLIRGESIDRARARLENVLTLLYPNLDRSKISDRVQIVCGDIARQHLGLSESAFERLAEEVTHIIHCAATTKFQLPLAYAREVNFNGTINMMGLARRAYAKGNLVRIAHVSTAYVCGDREGRIFEDELKSESQFANNYEQSKWEAEYYIRQLQKELPINIFRPSIVVGDSQTGRTTAFNVLYTPLQYIQRGIMRSLPCPSDTPLDVVPLDFVGNCICHILFAANGKSVSTYHIVAGDEAPSVGEIVTRAIKYFNRTNPGKPQAQVRFCSSLQCHDRRSLQIYEKYESYLNCRRIFDNGNTRAALADSGIQSHSFAEYCDRILAYCLQTNWGRTMAMAA